MLCKDGKPSAFYASYVKDIQAKVAENGRVEFDCIWKEFNRRVSFLDPTLLSPFPKAVLTNRPLFLLLTMIVMFRVYLAIVEGNCAPNALVGRALWHAQRPPGRT